MWFKTSSYQLSRINRKDGQSRFAIRKPRPGLSKKETIFSVSSGMANCQQLSEYLPKMIRERLLCHSNCKALGERAQTRAEGHILSMRPELQDNVLCVAREINRDRAPSRPSTWRRSAPSRYPVSPGRRPATPGTRSACARPRAHWLPTTTAAENTVNFCTSAGSGPTSSMPARARIR